MQRFSVDYPYATDLPSPPDWGKKHSSQFPTKYSQLPSIASPTPAVDKQVVPFNGPGVQKSAMGGLRTGSDMHDAQDRVQFLESRLGVTEKSNRTLLEEVLRLQNELRVNVHRNEATLREERSARHTLETSLKMCNDLIMQLSARIKATEEKILDEKSALSSLVGHTKGVEQAVVASQQELKARKDAQAAKLSDLETKLQETLRAKEQLEKTMYTLMDELRSVRNKVDSQTSEFLSATNELKLRSKRLEEENRLQMDSLRKQGDIQSHAEHGVAHLRSQVETRLSELREVILDIRSKQDQESTERRSLEQQLQFKANELHQAIGEQNRKREESMHALDMIAREREHVAEGERLKLQAQLAETIEDVNKKILTKEIKLREEIQDKSLQLEKTIQLEQQSRTDYERRVRDENEKRWAALKKMTDDEVIAIKDTIKDLTQTDRTKNKEAFLKLDAAITLLEQQLQENRKQVDKVIAAEIKSRKIHEKTTAEKIDDVQEKLQVATSTLQQAINGITSQVASNTDKLKREVKSMMSESGQASARAMTDMDMKLEGVKTKLSTIETLVDDKVAEMFRFTNPESQDLDEAQVSLSQNLRDKVDSISLWQDSTNEKIHQVNMTMQQFPNDIDALEERYKVLKAEMDSRVGSEAESRIRDVENLKQDINALRMRRQPQGVSPEEMMSLQQNVRKLAESIQTVKTVLGMKIQSEQKLRLEEVIDLKDEVAKLRSLIEPLVHNPEPRLFVKNPDEKDRSKAEEDAPDVNKWGLYNSYRWLTWKSKLMYFKWKKSSRKNQRNPSRAANSRRNSQGNSRPNSRPNSQPSRAGGDAPPAGTS
ncbi:coiled-coil domain-containing protein 154-like isoform X3 [Gigantopelta aegis]|uniref:coiled-coil domain-containing protein 154-like isoform X3 n=1 Tax=Gigantopelta aegis TaxID=1735272 RepID=UPI001B88DDA7|nr:coiled-coil domain-containing protein 154-like isoform X3 [Gigantopelta aegis]